MKKVCFLFVSTLFLLASAAQAQWIIQDLSPQNPAIAFHSVVLGVYGPTQQVGQYYYYQGGLVWGNASTWNSTPGSFTSFGHGIMYATDGKAQVGALAQPNGFDAWATRWDNGTVYTMMQLPGMTNSVAMAIFGGYSGGYYNIGSSGPFAILWKTTKPFNLHPSGMQRSLVDAMGNKIQAGYACPANDCFAAIWHNTANSVTILHPPGFQSSNIRGLQNSTGVGWATTSAGEMHAIIFDIAAGTTLDVHPTGLYSSGLNAISRDWAVGAVQFTSQDPPHAAVWDVTGSKAKYDLHTFLPPGDYTGSSAFAIWRDDRGTTYVGGMAISAKDGLQHPMLWSIP
jgi:uncharacterized membrane protein